VINFGIVIIGRNEGERLRRCFASIPPSVPREMIVYVDSGSTDQSVNFAQSLDVFVVRLDMSIPFSAGRARNEGFNCLTRMHRELRFVQFIDGDCELCAGWFEVAEAYLAQHENCVVVAGRTIEKFPQKSIYNFLCDIEWKTTFGKVSSCGGIFMIRKEPFMGIGGFNQDVTAGEEPEMCYRLRKLGWEIHRLDDRMVLHDAAMTTFAQWWKRAMRGGYSYAQGYALHGKGHEKYCLKESLRIWGWGGMVPGAILILTMVFGAWCLLVLAVYPAQLVRVAFNANKRFSHWRHSLVYAGFNILGKWPELCGQIKFWSGKFFRKTPLLIEYK